MTGTDTVPDARDPQSVDMPGSNKIIVLSSLSSLFQALAAFTLVAVISRLFEAPAYIVFSRFMFNNQLLVIICFEWVRLGTMRFANVDTESGKAKVDAVIMAAYVFGVAAVMAYNIFQLHSGKLDIRGCFILTVTVAAQAFSDISLIMMRFGGRLADFAKLQIYRNILIMMLVISVAAISRDPLLAELALMSANVLFLALLTLKKAHPFRWHFRDMQRETVSAFARFGIFSASASILHMAATASIREHMLLNLNPGRGAAFSACFDLMMKPFPLVFSIISTAVVPEMYRLFDQGQGALGIGVLRRFAAIVAILLMTLVAIDVGMAFAAPVIFSNLMAGGFMEFVLSLSLYFFFLVMLQSVIALVPQMMKAASICLWSAIAHIGLTVVYFSLNRKFDISSVIYFQVAILCGLIMANTMLFAFQSKFRDR